MENRNGASSSDQTMQTDETETETMNDRAKNNQRGDEHEDEIRRARQDETRDEADVYRVEVM